MRVRCPVMVGRDEELRSLRERVLAARGAIGSAIGSATVVAGEAGIGKSRLVRELVELGVVPVAISGRSVPTATPVPYRPFVEMMIGLARQCSLPAPDVLGPFGRALVPLVPDWQPAAATEGAEAMPSALVLGEGILRLLGAVAPDGALLVLEDVHWADDESLAVFEFLCDHIEASSVALVATLRDGEGNRAWRLADALVARGAADFVRLGPLGPSDVDAMVERCGYAPATRPVDAAEGRPLLVEELLGASGHDVPRTLRDAVRRQLSELGADGVEVVSAGALLGRRFDLAVVCRALATDDARVVEILRHAIRIGIVDSDGAQFRFRHALTRDAVLGELIGPDRVALSSRLHRALVTEAPDLPGPLCALAAQLATEAGDHDAVLGHLVECGRRAASDGALSSAIEILEQAVAERRHADGASTVAAHALLVEVLATAGRIDAAATACARLDAATGSNEDTRLDARARAHLLVAEAAAAGARLELAARELDAARGIGLDGDGLLRAELIEAMVALDERHNDRAVALATSVHDRAVGAGRVELACRALALVGQCERVHDLARAEAAFASAYRLAVGAGLRVEETRALHELGTIDLFTTGRVDRLEAALRRAEDEGAVMTAAMLHVQLGPAYINSGDREAALRHVHRAAADATALGLDALWRIAASLDSHVAAMSRDRDEIERVLAQFTAHDLELDPDAHAGIVAARGLADLLDEQRDGARRHLEAALAIVADAAEVRPQMWWGQLVVLRALAGDDIDGLVARIESSAAGVYRGNAVSVALARAIEAGRAGDPAIAAERAAAARLEQHTSPWQCAVVVRLTIEAARVDAWNEPSEWLADARAALVGFGAPAVVAAIDVLSSPSRAGVPGWLRQLGVSRREVDVLNLVAGGHSNRQIGDSLYISVRTVEKHVESLCRKLGVHTRGQLAATVSRRSAGPH